MDVNKVPLGPAFVWYCPDCEKEIFENPIEIQFDKTTEAQIKLETGLDDISGLFLSMPPEVTCDDCEKKFEAFDPSEPEEDDDPDIITPDTGIIIPD